MAAALMTQAAYSRHRKVTRQAVSKAVKRGRIHTVRGMIDPELADAEWQSSTAPALEVTPQQGLNASTAQGEAAQSSLNYATSRSIREAYVARLARLDYEQKSGELINAEKVRLDAFNTARRARDLLLAIPDRVAPIVAGLTDQAECHRVLLQEIHRVCAELSHADRIG